MPDIRTPEADNHKAFIQRWDITRDKRIRGVDRCDALKIDIGFGKLGRNVFY